MSPSPEKIIEPTPEKKSETKLVLKEEKGHKSKKQKLSDSVSQSPSKIISKETSSKHTKSPVNSSNSKTPLPPMKKKNLDDPKYSLWVDKYKPSSLKQIIGQQGEKSNVNKLVKWLANWYNNQSGKKKLTKPSKCITSFYICNRVILFYI